MNPKWRVLDLVNYSGSITAKTGSVLLSETKEKIPIGDVSIILFGQKTTLTTEVIQMLASYKTSVLFCDWRNIPTAAIHTWSDHGKVAFRHISQANSSLPKQKQAWATIIKEKIRGQAENLVYLDQMESAKKLYECLKNVKSGDVDNREAVAAKIYWKAIFTDSFRRSRDNEDINNKALNYAYTILRGHAIRAVLIAGLNPALGVQHHRRSNYFNLADDLIEPFRPVIDHTVINLNIGGDEHFLTDEIKKILVESTFQKYTIDGKTIPASLNELSTNLALYLEGTNNTFNIPQWMGPE